MPVRDSTRFGRTEILNRFRRELATRYVNLEPKYYHSNGLLGFEGPNGNVGYYVERMIPDAQGVPNIFYLIDEDGEAVASGSMYSVISALLDTVGRDNLNLPLPDFEFISDNSFGPGDWGQFYYDGKRFFVQFNTVHADPLDTSYNVFVTDENGTEVKNFNDLDDLVRESIKNARHCSDHPQYPKWSEPAPPLEPTPSESDTVIPSLVASSKRIKAIKLSEIVASEDDEEVEAIEASAKIFRRKPMREHIRECAYMYRPYRRVIHVEKMTPAEIRKHKQWLRKTKQHRKLYAKRYYKKKHLMLERNEDRRNKMHIRLKPHKPGFKFTYKR